MRCDHRLFTTLYALCGVAAVSCGSAAECPDVNFGSSSAVGRWEDEASETDAADDVAEASTTAASSGSVVPTKVSSAVAGRGAPAPTDSDEAGSADNAQDAATAMTGAAGAAGSETVSTEMADAGAANVDMPVEEVVEEVVEEPNGVTSLSFEVTTSAAGGRYQPRNVGAIWIEDGSGNFVKSLEVWAASRRRYLTGYVGALGGASIDVSTSATLRSHQTHTVTWDLNDRDGNAVAPGTYRVRMELTDANSTGPSHSVEFDTSAGPGMMTPSDASSFGSMKLELQ